jgi:hypothetical protein
MQQGLDSDIIHGIMAFLFALKFTIGKDITVNISLVMGSVFTWQALFVS